MDICRFCIVLSKILCCHVKMKKIDKNILYISNKCVHAKMSGLRRKEDKMDAIKLFFCIGSFLLRQILCNLDANNEGNVWGQGGPISYPSRRISLTLSCIIRPKSEMHLPAFWRMIPSCSRTLLDSAFENEAKCKSETEAAKREVLRLSDKFEQVWIFPSNCFSPTWTPSLANYYSFNRRVRGGGGGLKMLKNHCFMFSNTLRLSFFEQM